MIVLYSPEGVPVSCDAVQIADMKEAGYTANLPEPVVEVEEDETEGSSSSPRKKVLKTLSTKR